MSVLRHFAIFLTYAGLAAVLALQGPVWLPDLASQLGLPLPGAELAWPLAATVLFGGALLHEVYARMGRETYLSQQLLSLRHAYASLLEQQALFKEESAALRDAIEAADGKGGGKAMEDVVAEVKVLQGLVERLYSSRAQADSKAAGEPAPAAAAPKKQPKRKPAAKPQPANDAVARQQAAAQAVAQEMTAEIAAEPLPQFLTAAEPQAAAGGGGARALFRRRPKRTAEAKAPRPQKAAAPAAAPEGQLPPVDRSVDDAAIVAVLREALRDDGIQFVLQPIVSLPQRQKVFYECFSRLRTADGATIVPEQYIPVAEREGLVTAIDNMLLFRCVQLVRKIQRRNSQVDFFCNISLHTLCDTDFFSDFVDFLESNRVLAPNLIFEFTQASLDGWGAEEQAQLRRLARLGCRFSVDQVRNLAFDPERLASKGMAFVKIDAATLLGGGRRVFDLMNRLEQARMALVVTKIEDEQKLVELLDYGVSLGQGYLFGEPRLARPAD